VNRIVLATRNAHKIEELRAIFAELPLEFLPVPDAIEEPEETGLTFADNARLKATYYAQQTDSYALADDSGICIDALGGQPGVHSARWVSEKEWIPRVLELLQETSESERTARYTCAFALAAPDGTILAESEGTFEGRITTEPRGSNGFGYDPIFLAAPDFAHTAAQLSAEEKHARSHRGAAARALFPQLLAQVQKSTI
jgi:XTP/dITP diphosphohydrolase